MKLKLCHKYTEVLFDLSGLTKIDMQQFWSDLHLKYFDFIVYRIDCASFLSFEARDSIDRESLYGLENRLVRPAILEQIDDAICYVFEEQTEF